MGRIKQDAFPKLGGSQSHVYSSHLPYPAKSHLASIVKHLHTPLKSNFILLRGSDNIQRGRTDQAYAFDQESNFYYCTGSTSPDWILLYDIHKAESTLFIPPLRRGREVVYLGQLDSAEHVKSSYDVDHVFYHDDLGGELLISLTGIFYGIRDVALLAALTQARSVKDQYEIRAIRMANDISSDAHALVARNILRYNGEKEAEADFRRSCMLSGASEQAYGPIFGAGKNASVLHYGSNDQLFEGRELLLVDAACEYRRYAADVTRTYPISGKFSPRARILYEAVLKMQVSAIRMLKAGVSMQHLQDHVHKILAKFLVENRLVNCDLTVCVEKKLSRAFMPHGLGHHIGLDVHDVTPGLATAQVPSILAQAMLVAGNIVTIEPGIYFNEYYLGTFFADPELGQYFDKDECKSWSSLGGVRIEDCLLITAEGSENLTRMAKSIDEIERICCTSIRG